MFSKYLEKISGLPGSFMAAARKDAVQNVLSNDAKSAYSGLRRSSTVSGPPRLKPRVVQNRTGMNRGALLNKVAEFVSRTDSSLPYRRRVEVVIQKDGKVLLLKNVKGEDTWYTFPGGGTDGDTDEVAAKKECLEEAGIEISDLKKTDIFQVSEGISNKQGRDEKYRGSKTRVYLATFAGKDPSIKEKDSEGRKTTQIWVTPEEAKPLLKANKVDSKFRVEALTLVS